MSFIKKSNDRAKGNSGTRTAAVVLVLVTATCVLATRTLLAAEGDLLWAKSAGGTALQDFGQGIATFPDGGSVVTGHFEEAATFGAGEPNETTLVSAGGYEVFVAKYNPDGTLAWAKSAGGTYSDIGYAIATLSDGSALVTGRFTLSATFGAGEPNGTTLVSASAAYEIFVAKYNPDGTLAWAKSAGGTSSDYGEGIATLSDGSALVTGLINGTATFGAGEPDETTLVSVGGYDMFVAKYNPDGTLAWATSAGGTKSDGGWAIATLSDGSALVTGRFRLSATFGAGEPNGTTLVVTANSGLEACDMFVAKYNPDGTLAWARSAGSTTTDYAEGIASLSDGSALVTGRFEATATFGAGEPNETTLVSIDGYDIFVAKYDPDGTLAWAKSAGAWTHDYGHAIATLSDGSALVTGGFGWVATFGAGEPNETTLVTAGPGAVDVFVAKYNPDGTLAWATSADGTANDDGLGIATLARGSVLVTGYFGGATTFGAGESNETTLVPAGGWDIFVASFSTVQEGVVKAAIKIPKEGKRIAGNRVTVMAEIIAGLIEDVDNVLFQYRLVPSEDWVYMEPAVGNRPNPDTTAPYFIQWDVTDVVPDPSPYTCELRAVATSIAQIPDPDPEIRTVIIDLGSPDHDEGVNMDGDQELHASLLAAEQNEVGSGDPRSNIVVELTIPADAVPADTGGTILFLPTADYAPTLSQYESDCSAYMDLALDAGDLTGGKKALVKVHYPDADQDGLIDGTTLSELGLVLCRHDGSTWVPLEYSTVSPWTNTVQGLTTHLSSFGAIGLDDDGDRLSNEFEETQSSTSRTDSDTDDDGLSDYDEVGYDGDAGNYDPYDPNTNPSGTDLDANDPDTDGDGQSDSFEVEHGSDPLNPADSFVPAVTVVGLVALCLATLVLGGLLWGAKCSRADRPVPAQES